ncbi:MAG: hypothetical protein Q9212_007558 [Teloschistes hypoglaucus]
MAWWLEKSIELTDYLYARIHGDKYDRARACKKHRDKSDKSISSTPSATNDTTRAVANNNDKRTACFHDAVDDEDETTTDKATRKANRKATRSTDAKGTAPIPIVRPRDRLTDNDDDITYVFWIRGPGQLKSDQREEKASHKEILRKSRERYERLLAKQKELPEEERLIDWKRLEHTGGAW